jgi:hypothetical protein
MAKKKKRYAQILYGKAHWIFEAEKMPEYPPDSDGNPVVVVDLAGRDEVQEGWDYNANTDKFTPPVVPEIEITLPLPPAPDNAEVMQAINDLKADLIIAGVI